MERQWILGILLPSLFFVFGCTEKGLFGELDDSSVPDTTPSSTPVILEGISPGASGSTFSDAEWDSTNNVLKVPTNNPIRTVDSSWMSTTGLVALYSFDETSGAIQDGSGNGNHSAVPTDWHYKAPGVIGDGAFFLESQDAVVAPNASINNLPAVSVSAWVIKNDGGYNGWSSILSKTSGACLSCAFTGWRLKNDGSSPTLSFEVSTSGSDLYAEMTGSIMEEGHLYHVVVTWDGTLNASGVTFYVNGVDVGQSGASSDGSGTRDDDSGQSLYIGNHVYGYLDEVSLWNRVLTSGEALAMYNRQLDQISSLSPEYESEIFSASNVTVWESFEPTPFEPYGKELQLTEETSYSSGSIDPTDLLGYWRLNGSGIVSTASGSITDSSGNNNHGTFLDGATSASYTPGKFNESILFDGTDDYVNLGLLNDAGGGPTNDQLTVVAWFKYTNATPSYDRIISKQSSSADSDHVFMLGLRPYSGKYYLRGRLSTVTETDTMDDIRGSGEVTQNKWHMGVLRYDGTRVELLLDTLLVDASSNSGALISRPTTDTYIGAGYNSGIYYPFEGEIDETMIFNRSLSYDEIRDLYRRGLNTRYQVRACDDSACVGESFVGPDGTNTTYFSEMTNNSHELPSFDLSGIGLPNTRYFQYKVFLGVENNSYNAKLSGAKVTGSPAQ